jgi:mRNA interferase RelE/StbE
MSPHLVKIVAKAEKEIERLDHRIQDRIFDKVASLTANPLPAQVVKLKNTNCYRVRVGDYRIIYEILNDVIYILKVGHRKDVYK